MTDRAARSTGQLLLGWAKALFTPVAIAFLAYFIWQSRNDLATIVQQASVAYLVLAALIWSLLHLWLPVFATTVLGACGSSIGWWQAFSTHAARLPARYLPGGIWHTVGRVMDYHELEVPPRHLSVFVLLENGLSAGLTLCVGGIILYAVHGVGLIGSVTGLAGMLGLLALLALPYLIDQRILPGALSSSAYLRSLGIVAVFWAGATAAFLAYIHAFPSPAIASLEMAGVYLFSWGVGFIAIFAPQGIGVFEVVASELMDSPMGFMGLAALIAGFRVVVLVADLVTWSAYQLLRRRFDA